MDAVIGQVCIPGERLSSEELCQAGRGTYIRQGYVFASLAGHVEKEIRSAPALPIVSVKSKNKTQSVPAIGAIVTCKITQITSRFAKCQIIAVNNKSLSEPFRGMIRKENIRETDRDRVEIYKCFRPGDIALAKVVERDIQGIRLANGIAFGNTWSRLTCVGPELKDYDEIGSAFDMYFFELSLGDASCYLLTTAENELGVVVSHSDEGVRLIPLSHNEMQCPVTFVKDSRKVARPQTEHLVFPER